MEPRINRRSSWGPQGHPVRDFTPKRAIVIHHSAGFDTRPETRGEQATVLRAIDSFHLKGNGWSGGIGYCLVVFQPRGRFRRARVWEGRGEDQVPAAQLNHNSGTIPICVIDSLHGERLRPATVRRIKGLVRGLKARHPDITHLEGHREVPGQGTECPGSFVFRHLGEFAAAAGLKRGGWPL